MDLLSAARGDRGTVRIVGVAFAAALALRLLCLWELHRSGLWNYLRLDPLYYHDWAVRIARGDVLGTSTFEMTPLYAYLLALVFKLFGYGLLVPRLLQALAGAGTCAIVAWLGCRTFGRAEGIIAGMIALTYAPSLFHESQIMKTVLTMALSTATAAVLYVSCGARARALALGGALLGAAALAQENITVSLPLLAAWIAWRAPRDRRLSCVCALLAGFACVVAPVTIRNRIVSGEFVLITSGGGEVFYTGNNEYASGHYRPPPFVRPDPFFEHEDFRAEAARRLARPVTRRESDAFWWGEGIRFIRSHLARYPALLWDKLGTYFNDFERPDNYSFYNFRRFLPVLRWPLPSFGWVAPLGILGVVLSVARWPDLLPLYATMGAYLVSALLFFTQSRYRMPMIPLLALFGAHAVVWLGRAARERRAVSLSVSLALLAALALFMNRDPDNGAGFDAQNHGILGEMYLHAGRPREAREEFLQTLRMMERLPAGSADEQSRRVVASAHLSLVLALQAEEAEGSSGAEDEMILHLRSAADTPDADLRHDALSMLGGLMMKRGDPAGAAEAYAGAVRADPEDRPLSLRLAEALHKAGRLHEALEVAEQVIRQSGDADAVTLGDAHYGAALLYRDLGEPGPMRAHLRETLRLNPTHPRSAWIQIQIAAPDQDEHPKED